MLTGSVAKKHSRDKEQRIEAFYQEHFELVYRAAFSVTHSRQDAEDVLQNVFANVLRHPERAEQATNVKGFLYRAAIKEGLYLVRTRVRQRIEGNLEDAEQIPESTGSLLEDQTRAALLEVITKLKPEEVELLVLRYEQGYSDAEIARMMGCSRTRIAVTLYRVRAQMKKLMRETVSNGAREKPLKGLAVQF